MPPPEARTLHLAPHHLQLLQALLHQHVPHAQVWAYGSRVHGVAHEGSDLDLVLRNPGDLSRETSNLPGLQAAVQASTLPMLIDLHDWAHLSQAFHRNIEAGYVVVQAGSPRI